MKIFLLVAAGCIFAFAGCERHPVSQLEEINQHSEADPEKKKQEAAHEQAGATASASVSPRAYFSPSSK